MELKTIILCSVSDSGLYESISMNIKMDDFRPAIGEKIFYNEQVYEIRDIVWVPNGASLVLVAPVFHPLYESGSWYDKFLFKKE